MDENRTFIQKQRFFALCGVIAPILFTFLVIVESLIRPGYSQIFNDVSDLGIGPYAIIQNINFIIFGLLSIGFAMGLGANLQHRAGKAAKWLVIVFGLCIILAGATLFSVGSDVTYAKDVVSHGLVSAIAFLVIIVAQFMTWLALKGNSSAMWGHYRTYSLISGLMSILTLVILSYTQFSLYHGATERLFIAVWMIWIEVTGIKLYSLTEL
jgi:Predicted membrane protein